MVPICILLQIILPCVFITLAMLFTKIKPQNGDQPEILLTPDLYGPETAMFYRMNDKQPMYSDMVDSFVWQPGVSTKCMEDSNYK